VCELTFSLNVLHVEKIQITHSHTHTYTTTYISNRNGISPFSPVIVHIQTWHFPQITLVEHTTKRKEKL